MDHNALHKLFGMELEKINTEDGDSSDVGVVTGKLFGRIFYEVMKDKEVDFNKEEFVEYYLAGFKVGFHKGLKCVDKERMMLTINITTEEEKFGRFKMSRERLDKLSEDDRFRCRFMEIV